MRKVSSSNNRSKRRKIQKEISALNYEWPCDIFSNIIQHEQDIEPHSANFNQTIPLNLSSDQEICITDNPSVQLNINSFNFNNDSNIPNEKPIEKKFKLPMNESNQLSEPCNKFPILDHQQNIQKSLCRWAVSCNIPQSAVNKLLTILKYETHLDFLPKDCRTLLDSGSKKVLNLRKVEPNGIYFHFGLKEEILRYSSIIVLNENIKISIGIDGLPLSKSSSTQFWPILAYILPHKQYVFPIGIFYGHTKPKNSNEFLKDLISEILQLSNNGIYINNIKKKNHYSSFML